MQATAWKNRLNSASAAQTRYLWLMLLLGIFFWAVHIQVNSAVTRAPDSFVVPVLGLPLPTLRIWESAPAVLFFIILAFFGALRAYTKAHAQLAPAPGDETTDEHPNALDWVAYTTPKSPALARGLLGFTYPLYVTVFTVEAAFILICLVRVPIEIPGRLPLVIVAGLEGIAVLGFLLNFWGGRYVRLRNLSAA